MPGQRWAVPRSFKCRSRLDEEANLTVDGGEVVLAKKVEGSALAWQFVATYAKMLTSSRTAALTPNNNKSAQLLADLLPVAIKYDMPELVRECEEPASGWTSFSPSHVDDLDDPDNPIWWINLAAKHGRLNLAAPAVRALVTNCGGFGYGGGVRIGTGNWNSARCKIKMYGKEKQEEVWKLVYAMLDECQDI